jgi:apolipoprotein N-acyltransferase
VGVLICIDTSYPDLVRQLRTQGARLLIELSNEAGTGHWSARLHARIARFRAVELRTPFVRVANTGPTQWIDARGRLVHALAPGASDAAVRALALAGPPPPAAHLAAGAVVAAALGFGIGVSGLSAGFRRRAYRRATRGSWPRFNLNQVMEGTSRWNYENMR